MRKFLLLSLVLLSLSGFAQRFNVEGTLTSEKGESLPAATVLLLNASDSVMSQFGISNPDGLFILKGIEQGDYILQVSFIGYDLFYKNISVDKDLKLGDLKLSDATYQLNQVTLEDYRVPMRIKDDTIAYDAKAFTTKPNAVVEKLLEKLPGVEVEEDGSIKAQGEDVQNVLVDGKEFFGDDPTIATKNLPADAIDQVEIYDKLSDMAEFTGIEDGEEEKTINLVLKEDAKAGYFGNVYGGVGYDPELYEGKAMINRFTKDNQMSLLALSNNNNSGGFSARDYIQFMGGIRALMDNNGMVDLSSLGAGTNTGLNTSSGIGLNYNKDWTKKTKLRFSYFLNHLNTELRQQTDRFYEEQRGFDESNEDLAQESSGLGHRGNLKFTHKIDSAQKVRFRGQLSFNEASLEEELFQASLNNNELRSTFDANQNGESFSWAGFGRLSYQKKLSKTGRNFGAEFSYTGGLDDQKSFLQQALNDNESLNQRQYFQQADNSYEGGINYTEPLFGKMYLSTTIDYAKDQTIIDKRFFDIQSNDIEIRNNGLSRYYESVFNSSIIGAQVQRKAKKFKWSFGLNGRLTSFEGRVEEQAALRKEFNALLPNASFRYKVSGAKTFRLNYNARLSLPTIDQLQPLVDNSNPQRVFIGNANLDASRVHSVSSSYSSFNQFNFTSFNAFLNVSQTDNAIVNSVITDSLARQILVPVNVDYAFNSSLSLSFSAPIRAIGMKFRIRARESYRKSIQPLENVDNVLDRFEHSGGIKIENRKKETVDFGVGVNLSYSQSNYSELSNRNQTFFSTDYYADFTWYLPKFWTVSTDFSYQVFDDRGFGSGQSFPFLGFELSKQFLEDQKGELSLRVVDALDQNRGFARNANWNYIEERTANNLGRFFMLRFTYSLKGFGAGPPMPPGRGGRR